MAAEATDEDDEEGTRLLPPHPPPGRLTDTYRRPTGFISVLALVEAPFYFAILGSITVLYRNHEVRDEKQ